MTETITITDETAWQASGGNEVEFKWLMVDGQLYESIGGELVTARCGDFIHHGRRSKIGKCRRLRND